METTMTTITLHNNFHGTETSIMLRHESQVISASTIRRVRAALCGSPDCACGGPLGERPIGYQCTHDGLRVEIVALPFGEILVRALPR
jgi:hypothetical protein